MKLDYQNTVMAKDVKLYLLRIYGDVEPEIVAGPARDEDSLEDALIKHLMDKPYNEEDGLYRLKINQDGRPEVYSLSCNCNYIDEVRKKAERKTDNKHSSSLS